MVVVTLIGRTLLLYEIEELALSFFSLFFRSIGGNESIVLQGLKVSMQVNESKHSPLLKNTYSDLEIGYFCKMILVCRHYEGVSSRANGVSSAVSLRVSRVDVTYAKVENT